MNIYLIKRLGNDVGYSEVDGFVIAAKSHHRVRRIAFESSGGAEDRNVWLNYRHTSLKLIGKESPIKKEGVLLCDFMPG